MSGPVLTLTGVSFAYGPRPVVTDASLKVAAGRIVGLLGPNGSGKSTLLRLAAGLLRPRAGAVRLAGRDVGSLRRAEVARRVALLPQDGALPDAFTGRELVLLGRTPHLGRFAAEGPTDRAIVERALALADAAPFADRRLGELSGGERQRLLLARVLAQEPDLLLLDEPTAHLDLAHQLATLDLVRRLAREEGLAVLAVFHDLNLAAEYCDELVLLVDGRIAATGPPAATVTADVLQTVFGVRPLVVRHPVSGRPAVLPPAGTRSAATHRQPTVGGAPLATPSGPRGHDPAAISEPASGSPVPDRRVPKPDLRRPSTRSPARQEAP